MPARAVTATATFKDRLISTSSSYVADRQFGDVRAMQRALVALRRDHGLAGEADVSIADLGELLVKLESGRSLTPRELRDCAFGVATDVDGFGRVLDSPNLAEALLSRIEATQAHPRRERRIVSGLLSGYLAYRPVDHADASGPWHLVREWLSSWLDHRGADDPYFEPLREHRNLLTLDPCRRYADPEKSAGDVNVLRNELGVSPNSWVFGEILLAQVENTCQREDSAFYPRIGSLVVEAGFFPSFEGSVLALLLDRYATSGSRATPHEKLKDAGVSRWGNPLDSATYPAWRAVSTSTRKMVEGWVKRYVIELFFGAISARFATESRRTDFWLRYVDEIDDLHLFFGDSAYRQDSKEFRELREAVGGKYSRMESDPDNNGFLMVIGGVGFVEFSNHANACYVYDARDLPFDRARRVIPITSIKNQARALGRLIHRDDWEVNFAQRIRYFTGRR